MKHRLCKKREKPIHKKECHTHECPPVWYKGSWSKVKLLTLYALMDSSFWFGIISMDGPLSM